MFKRKLTYKDILFFVFSSAISIFLSSAYGEFCFLSLSFYVSLLYLGLNPFLSSIIYLIGFLPCFDLKTFYSALISIAILLPIFLIYIKKQKKVRFELSLYLAVSLLGFIFLCDGSYVLKIISAAVSIILSFVFISSSRVIFIKKLDYKLTVDELLSICAFFIAVELGIINLLGINVVKAINIFIILSLALAIDGKAAVTSSIVLSIAPMVFSNSFIPVATYALLALSCAAFIGLNKILSAFALVATDLLITFFTDAYPPFLYSDLIFLLTPIVIYLFLPGEIYDKIKKKLDELDGRNISRFAINRLRSTIAGRLCEVSDVFKEMEQSFTKLKECVTSDDALVGKMTDEVILSVCEKCPSYVRCRQLNYPDRKTLYKIISIGVAKNRISLVDLTKTFTETCSYVNSIIFAVNELIGKYREKIKESEDLLSGKELIRMQSKGVSEVLRGMSLEFSKALPYSSEYENKLADALKKNGILFSELMAIKQGESLEINLVIKNEFLKNGKLLDALNKITNTNNAIILKTPVSTTTSAVTVRRSPKIDAAFGLAYKTKEGSLQSGDTHALTKIDEGKFLIALSDGMGSGAQAESTSETAISLIESFYRAGLNSKLILSMVNKVLSLNVDDNFSAMDILTVNLFDLSADFIKIGAPYSFILSDDNIKIIEGSSLPLGILDDLTPTGCSSTIQEGSTIIMVTDGVSDAFGSTTDFIDFLRTLENRNPQKIADSILNMALNSDMGIAKDDMTVLAVKLFKKAS